MKPRVLKSRESYFFPLLIYIYEEQLNLKEKSMHNNCYESKIKAFNMKYDIPKKIKYV